MRRIALLLALCSALCLSSVSLGAKPRTGTTYPGNIKPKKNKAKVRKARKYPKTKVRRNSAN
jgi:hypothetical protein